MGTVQIRLINRPKDISLLICTMTQDWGLFHEITAQGVSSSYLRPLLSFGVKGVSNHPGLGLLHAPLHKLIVNVLLHVRPGPSTAALPLVEEQGKVGLIHSPVH